MAGENEDLICLFKAVEHFALHAMLQLSTTYHAMDHFHDSPLWVFL